MFTIKIADLTVEIHNRYPYVRRLCENYVIEDTEKPDMIVSVSDEEIEKEMVATEVPTMPGYAEGVCVYRSICQPLPTLFGAYLLHGAVIEYEGRGYIFTAKSGTGKSTHIGLWQKRFGDGVRVINGDKPIMRFREDALYAYGTPWCGKEGWQTNASVPIHAICFLERAEENSIVRIEPKDAVARIYHQIVIPADLQAVDALFPLLDRTLTQVPCYVLGCNISEEAAEVAYNGMNPDQK